MDNIEIRPLKKEDADDIAVIYSSIVLKNADADFKRLIENHAEREEDACFVAEQDGQVVGFMISYIMTLGFGIEKAAWIATLGVDPEFMGRGIGEGMAKEIFKLYKKMGVNRVYTSVRWDSADLLSFFKTLGFGNSKFVNLKKDLD